MQRLGISGQGVDMQRRPVTRPGPRKVQASPGPCQCRSPGQPGDQGLTETAQEGFALRCLTHKEGETGEKPASVCFPTAIMLGRQCVGTLQHDTEVASIQPAQLTSGNSQIDCLSNVPGRHIKLITAIYPIAYTLQTQQVVTILLTAVGRFQHGDFRC